jgi:hypothetical protein
MSWRASRRRRAAKALPLAALLLASAARAQTTNVALGIEALARRDVAGAERDFRLGTTSDNPLVRPAAWQWLGHVAWKFRGDTASAKRYLDRALVEARDSSQILLEVARLAGARRRYHDAVRVAYDAMTRSVDGERRGMAARTVVELAVDGAFAGRRAPIRDSVDLRVIASVRDTLLSRVARFPGRTVDAGALIDAAAMLGDSASVHTGLRSYFSLESSGWDGTVGNDALVEQLRRGRLHQAAALYLRATGIRLVNEEWGDEIPYANFLRDIGEGTERVYRAELAGTARPGDIARVVNSRGRQLWTEILWGGKAPAFYPAYLYRTLGGRYGAHFSIERSGAFEELYFGHVLITLDDPAGGTSLLDNFVASGIDDWLLDGAGGRAGWVANDTIYERRTGFTETPFRALLALTDPQTMPGELFRITRDSIGDLERAKRDSLGYLPGVAARMFRSGAQALLDSVKTPEAFTRAMFSEVTHTSIGLHETRHRNDRRSGRPSTPSEDEFRAKLDEVTGAALPRLALTAILSPTIGDGSPHGQANRRIMIGLNRWIRRNGTSIAGYDARQPALLQLPLLTNAQLKAAFASMRAR